MTYCGYINSLKADEYNVHREYHDTQYGFPINSSINETETKSNPYKDEFSDRTYIQLHKSYIIFQVKSGLMIIDQQHAHQRILFERYYSRTNEATVFTQTDLFPTT